jgi:cell division transport system permease protein
MQAARRVLSRLLIPRPDLPFSREDANRFLPWIIGIMTVLTALALAAGLALNDVMVAQIAEFDQRYQIHIPYDNGKEKRTAQSLMETLPKQQGITRVELMSEAKVSALLEPWLGSSTPVDMLPVPLIIDVWVSADAVEGVAAQDALSALSAQYPDLIVERFASWVDKFNDTARNMQRVIYGVALLMLVAMVAVIILITRASVQLHFDIVKLLHRMGAKDHYISRQFQWNAIWLTLKGALPGAALAALITAVCFLFINQLDVASPIASQTGAYVALFLLLPAFLTLCVGFSTYTTVRHTLRRMH